MNVVFVLLDTLRRDHLGCYGNRWVQTPHLDRFAAGGVSFDNCYLGSSPCMPARREILTGRYEFPYRGWGPLEPGDRDLAETLTHHNRSSMLITDHYHLFEHGAGNYHTHFTGWDFIRGQENDHWVVDPAIAPRFPAPEKTKCHFRWAQYMRNTAQWRNADGQWTDEKHTFTSQTFRRAADWIDRNTALHNQDFFLMIDHFDPHEPFDPPAPYDTMYCDGSPPAERVRWPIYGEASRYTAEELADIRALYAGKVTLVDRWFGHFLDRLEKHGLLANTMIVVTTDHGHLFGEHGMIGKPGNGHGDATLYQEMAHLPLIVRHPDFATQAGSRRRALVQAVDYYPTILEGMQLPTATQSIHGRSLLPLLQSPAANIREYACFAKYGEAIHITDGEWTLAKWPPATAQGDRNAPLYWYSALPPEFIVPKGLGPFDRENLRYPVTHVRGKGREALWQVAQDPAQRHNRLATEPAEAARLTAALGQFLAAINAPVEQFERLGIPRVGASQS